MTQEIPFTEGHDEGSHLPPGPEIATVKDASKFFVLRKDKSVKDRVLHPGESKKH